MFASPCQGAFVECRQTRQAKVSSDQRWGIATERREVEMVLGQEIERLLEEIQIVDTHEHLYPPGTIDPIEDLPNLLRQCYVVYDLISAGMAPDVWVTHGWAFLSETVQPEEGWQRLAPFMSGVQNTALYRYLLRSLSDLYDISERDLEGEGWKEVSRAIREANQRPDWFEHVFRERAHIRVCLLDHPDLCPWGSFEADRRYFIPVLRVDDFMMGSPFLTRIPRNTAAEIAQRLGRGQIKDLDDLTELVDHVFEQHVAGGGRAIKVAMAYSRCLQFQGVSRAEARYQFKQVMAGAYGPDARKVSDFMLGYCVQRAIEHNLPIQVHTGMQTGNGTWTRLEGARPNHLTNLFHWFPKARFVLLHGGFPFTGEAGVLAKTFPNVYLDFAWVPLVSPTAARNALSEWLEMVPGNKIMWGGDVQTVEELYGAVLALREVLGSVLTEKVQGRYLTLDGAAALARGIIADNATRLFGLDT
jgi:hypothetical protein